MRFTARSKPPFLISYGPHMHTTTLSPTASLIVSARLKFLPTDKGQVLRSGKSGSLRWSSNRRWLWALRVKDVATWLVPKCHPSGSCRQLSLLTGWFSTDHSHFQARIRFCYAMLERSLQQIFADSRRLRVESRQTLERLRQTHERLTYVRRGNELPKVKAKTGRRSAGNQRDALHCASCC